MKFHSDNFDVKFEQSIQLCRRSERGNCERGGEWEICALLFYVFCVYQIVACNPLDNRQQIWQQHRKIGRLKSERVKQAAGQRFVYSATVRGFDNLISIWKQLKIDESSQSDESDLIMLLIRVNNEAVFKFSTFIRVYHLHSWYYFHTFLYAIASIMSFHALHWNSYWNLLTLSLLKRKYNIEFTILKLWN